jgi:AcrR family transcriptional regulator
MRKHTRAAYQEAILDAAANVFGRVGFTDAKMADIAADAGVSVGTLYNYFESRDDVIESLTSHEHERLRAQLAEVCDGGEPIELLRLTVEAVFRYVQERGALMAMAMRSGLLDKDAAKHTLGERDDLRSELLRRYQTALTEAAEKGVVQSDLDPAQVTIALDGMVTALVFDWVRSGQTQPLTSRTEFVLALLLRGIGTR